ncbi:hypothetical protein [Rhodoferax ferrireducens]|uniref:hypothetical protein n=1 Tax=Rhodoferax ferrireducens TaxID=192843 RepID=UPI000E0D42D3|nr:hypothetical protein [Rhodoferax ferrireducens]
MKKEDTMTDATEFKYWRFCAWMGPVFMSVFIVFWGIMGHNIPPWNADLPAATIANWFRTEANTIRTGMVLSMTFAVLYAVWGLAIGRVMTRIVPKDSILVDLQVWGAGLTVVPVLVSTSFWLAGAYRPEALPDYVLQLLYDMAWLLIDLAYAVTTVQLFAAGVGFMRDKRTTPLIPKWLAWYGIWVGFMFVAECLMPFFKTGAFARDGILNFWIEFMIWFVWCPTLTFYILKAINRIEREERT